jgi:small-conductance mechanosensitive channel
MKGRVKSNLFLACGLLAACASSPQPSPEESEGAAMDMLRAAVATVVKDPARASEVTAAVDTMQNVFDEAMQATRAHTERLRNLDANYDTTEADMRKALQSYNAGRAQRQMRLLAARDRIAASTTDGEWEQLAKARRAVIESIVKPR